MSEATGSTICPKCGRYYIHVEQTVTAPQPTCECYKSENQIIQPSIGHDQVTISGEEYRRLINLQSAHDKLKERLALSNVKALGKAPIVEWFGEFIIMAQSGRDLDSKQRQIKRGDTHGFYTLQTALNLDILTPEEMEKL